MTTFQSVTILITVGAGIYWQPRGAPVRKQVSGIPYHQPGQADVRVTWRT